MKNILFAVTVLLVTHFSAFAAEPAKAPDAKMQEMMKKHEAYSTPGEQHKRLAELEGNWTYTSKMWMSPKDKPQEAKGTSTFKMILGGRWLQQDTKGEVMGMPFEGIALTGYNNLKGEYETIWLDSMSTGAMYGTGSYDAKKKTLSDKGSYTCPFSEDKSRDYRADLKIKDKNNMTYSSYGPGINGEPEYKHMEIVYKRAK